MFKIRVQSLPAAGLKIDQNIPVDSINQRLAEAPDAAENPISFLGEIKLDLLCEKAAHGMTLTGQLESSCSQACSLCAEPVSHQISVPVSHIFKHDEKDDSKLPEDDIGLTYYRGEHVDLQSCIEDLLILQLTPYWHPPQDCNGQCLVCKKNPREGQKVVKLGTQSLGDILKKAGIN